MAAMVSPTGTAVIRAGSQRAIRPTPASALTSPAPPGCSQNTAADPARNRLRKVSCAAPADR
jgi:hypothetical protein